MKANPIWARQVALTRLVMAYVNSLGNFMIFYSAKHLSPHEPTLWDGEGVAEQHTKYPLTCSPLWWGLGLWMEVLRGYGGGGDGRFSKPHSVGAVWLDRGRKTRTSSTIPMSMAVNYWIWIIDKRSTDRSSPVVFVDRCHGCHPCVVARLGGRWISFLSLCLFFR